LEAELTHDGREVLDMSAPRDLLARIATRSPTAALVIENETVPVGEGEVLRQEVIVMSAGAAMQYEEWTRRLGAVFTPVQWDRR
jgi:hypothetical protein